MGLCVGSVREDGFGGEKEREVKEEERFGGWGRPWETVRRRKREEMDLVVWLGLWFYLQNVYVAPPDWRV